MFAIETLRRGLYEEDVLYFALNSCFFFALMALYSSSHSISGFRSDPNNKRFQMILTALLINFMKTELVREVRNNVLNKTIRISKFSLCFFFDGY